MLAALLARGPAWVLQAYPMASTFLCVLSRTEDLSDSCMWWMTLCACVVWTAGAACVLLQCAGSGGGGDPYSLRASVCQGTDISEGKAACRAVCKL